MFGGLFSEHGGTYLWGAEEDVSTVVVFHDGVSRALDAACAPSFPIVAFFFCMKVFAKHKIHFGLILMFITVFINGQAPVQQKPDFVVIAKV